MSDVCIVIDNSIINEYLSNAQLVESLKEQYPSEIIHFVLTPTSSSTESVADSLSSSEITTENINDEYLTNKFGLSQLQITRMRTFLSTVLGGVPNRLKNAMFDRRAYPTVEEVIKHLEYRKRKKEQEANQQELARINYELFDLTVIQDSDSTALNPIERRRRVLLISTLFSAYVRAHVQDVKNNPGKYNKTFEEVKTYDNIKAILELGSKKIFNTIHNLILQKANSVTDPVLKAKYDKFLRKEVFSSLLEEVLPILEITEGIQTVIDEDMEKEESFKENWMVNFRETSTFSSMSKKVRRFINTILKFNYKGNVVTDDLGFTEFLDPIYVHAFFIDKLRVMTSADLLFPLLEKIAKSEPWVKNVITELKKPENELLKSAFYQDFRKDFNNFSVQTIKRRLDGTYAVESKPLNKPIGIYYLLEAWRNNYLTGNILSELSIYDKDGSWNKENAKQSASNLLKLINSESGSITLKILEELNDSKSNRNTYKQFVELLNAAGITLDEQIIKSWLESKNDESKLDYVRLILTDLEYIFNQVALHNEKSTIEEEYSTDSQDTIIVYKDLINNFSTKYTNIAKEFAVVDLFAIEDNIRVGGKNIYTHSTPNYLGKLVKLLNNEIQLNDIQYTELLEKEFGYDLWFKETREIQGEQIELWNNSILKDLLNNKEFRKHFLHKILLTRDNKEYADWDSLDTSLLLLKEFETGIESQNINLDMCNVAIPILADAQSAEFLSVRRYKFDKLNYVVNGKLVFGKEALLDKLYLLALLEWHRILRVRARLNDPTIEKIANYDKRGLKFCFIEELNDYMDILDKQAVDDINSFETTLRTAVRNIYEQKFREFLEKQKAIGIFDKNSKGKRFLYLDNLKYTTLQQAESFLEEYFYNFCYAESQIIQLIATDLAFYKDMDDFSKRIKEVHSPSLKLDTEAAYKGVKIGRKYLNVLHIKDSLIVSEILETLKSILDEKVKQGVLSSLDRDFIYNKFKTVNVADAQAFRSIHSYRDIMIMAGRWDVPGVEEAYQNLIQGKWDILDFMTIWLTIKPFNYTLRSYYNGENASRIKGGLQHKNSEFPLIALYSAIVSPLALSPQLLALHKILNDPNLKIDCIQFESTTKVGKQGVINIHDKGSFAKGTITINKQQYSFDSYDELQNILDLKYENGELTKEQVNTYLRPYKLNTADEVYNAIINAIEKDGDKQQVLLKVSFEDYGIQVENPEHIIDHIQLFGTLIRKLIAADMDLSDTDVIEVDGEKMTKAQWLNLYNALNTENIIESFREVDAIFSDPKEVEKILLLEIASSPRYGKDLKEACTLDENGRFRIPLFDPIQSTRVLLLLNSILRKRITGLKIRGGTCVLVSDFGLTDLLNIKFKNELGEIIDFEHYKRKNRNKHLREYDLRKEYNEWTKQLLKNGNLSVAYFECYMPAYSKEFYEPLMTKDSKGNMYLDVNKLPDDLRKCIGYRIPTENKYSMAPLYIKGFLPLQNGSCIMLPADITTIAGSDFDIKLYWCH